MKNKKRLLFLHAMRQGRGKRIMWSGTYFYIDQQLRKNFDVIGSDHFFFLQRSFFICEHIHSAALALMNRLGAKTRTRYKPVLYAYKPYIFLCGLYFRVVQYIYRVDVVFFVTIPFVAAYSKASSKKVLSVYCNDACYPQLDGYYEMFTNILPKQAAFIRESEKRALENAGLVVMSNEWATNGTLQHYGIPKNKIETVHFGANIDVVPSIKEIGLPKQTARCNLLLISMDWERKGGDIAVEALEELLKMGLSAHLTIVGEPVPEAVISHKEVTFVGRLDKRKPSDVIKLERLYKEASFLILPSRAECAAMVVAEANAYGVPSIVSDTGGLSCIVKRAQNGYVLPYEARGEQYAAQIAEIFSKPQEYHRLCRASREHYDKSLNWDQWGEKVNKLIMQRLDSSRR